MRLPECLIILTRMEPGSPQSMESCHPPGILPGIYSCGQNYLDSLIKNLNRKPQMDKKSNQNWGLLPDYLWVETKTSVCFHSGYVNLLPCVHSLWQSSNERNRPKQGDTPRQSSGLETHLEMPQCSLQKEPNQPCWGSLKQHCHGCPISLRATAVTEVPNLWRVCTSSHCPALCAKQGCMAGWKGKCQGTGTAQREVLRACHWGDCFQQRKNGRQVKREPWTYTPVTVNRGWGQRKRPLRWQLLKTDC